jgi:hypothetical protein
MRHMAYDEDLANRIRELVLMERGISEKRNTLTGALLNRW